ncbi:hypothetical protein F5884DRAFT_277353 [Xylogone sp. PMI_703]|nr:hypothetical protein F5884DRAFT_277353 [Xylogone sp. PMI_703]
MLNQRCWTARIPSARAAGDGLHSKAARSWASAMQYQGLGSQGLCDCSPSLGTSASASATANAPAPNSTQGASPARMHRTSARYSRNRRALFARVGVPASVRFGLMVCWRRWLAGLLFRAGPRAQQGPGSALVGAMQAAHGGFSRGCSWLPKLQEAKFQAKRACCYSTAAVVLGCL